MHVLLRVELASPVAHAEYRAMDLEQPSTVKRTVLDRDIAFIRLNLRHLGARVEDHTRQAVLAIYAHDAERATGVIEADQATNALRYRVEQDCLNTIATQQPEARDLRRIVAALHIAVELERMGDHAAGIAKCALDLGDQTAITPPPAIRHMQEVACNMVQRAVAAFSDADVEQARSVLAFDRELHELYQQSLRVLLTFRMQDAALATIADALWSAVHHLKRIGDRATNVCERVFFAEAGDLGDYRPEQPPSHLE